MLSGLEIVVILIFKRWQRVAVHSGYVDECRRALAPLLYRRLRPPKKLRSTMTKATTSRI
jgi:hypothetical protein